MYRSWQASVNYLCNVTIHTGKIKRSSIMYFVLHKYLLLVLFNLHNMKLNIYPTETSNFRTFFSDEAFYHLQIHVALHLPHVVNVINISWTCQVSRIDRPAEIRENYDIAVDSKKQNKENIILSLNTKEFPCERGADQMGIYISEGGLAPPSNFVVYSTCSAGNIGIQNCGINFYCRFSHTFNLLPTLMRIYK